MEDLAALVATILAVFVGMAVINILLAVLSRRKKLKPWIAMVFNALTGFAAIFGISISLGDWDISATGPNYRFDYSHFAKQKNAASYLV